MASQRRPPTLLHKPHGEVKEDDILRSRAHEARGRDLQASEKEFLPAAGYLVGGKEPSSPE